MNEMKIHISLEQHENIIRFIGFHRSKQTFGIIFEVAEDNLLNMIKMEKFQNRQTHLDFFSKCVIEIINGMVSLILFINLFNIIIDVSSSK
jgi:hypothetical protein